MDRPQGYLALEVLDLNHDSVIDVQDSVFKELRLWQDRNHDGVSDRDEMLALETYGILGVDVRFEAHRAVDKHGNLFRYSANVVRAPGSHVGPRSYDVFLITQRLDQQAREQGAVQDNGAISLASVEPETSCTGDPEPVARWTCDASCNVQQIDPNKQCPDRVTGRGTGTSSRAACGAAERDANTKVPTGCYKRHCHCDCYKGNETAMYDDDFMMTVRYD